MRKAAIVTVLCLFLESVVVAASVSDFFPDHVPTSKTALQWLVEPLQLEMEQFPRNSIIESTHSQRWVFTDLSFLFCFTESVIGFEPPQGEMRRQSRMTAQGRQDELIVECSNAQYKFELLRSPPSVQEFSFQNWLQLNMGNLDREGSWTLHFVWAEVRIRRQKLTTGWQTDIWAPNFSFAGGSNHLQIVEWQEGQSAYIQYRIFDAGEGVALSLEVTSKKYEFGLNEVRYFSEIRGPEIMPVDFVQLASSLLEGPLKTLSHILLH